MSHKSDRGVDLQMCIVGNASQNDTSSSSIDFFSDIGQKDYLKRNATTAAMSVS
jgi:hypothetical protein